MMLKIKKVNSKESQLEKTNDGIKLQTKKTEAEQTDE